MRGFLVQRGTPGFTTRNITGKFALKAFITSELVLQDCRIPEENLLPGSSGLKSALMCLSQARHGAARVQHDIHVLIVGEALRGLAAFA